MTRTEAESEILERLREIVPDGVEVGSLPMGRDSARMFAFREAACWVVYSGGRAGANRVMGASSQDEKWSWSVIILAKSYRAGEAGADALALLDLVASQEGLSGWLVPCLGDRLEKQTDAILPLPEGKGVMGYEARFGVDTIL